MVERLFKFAVVARSGLFIMLSYIKLVKPEPEPTTKPHIFSDNNTVALLDVKLYQLTSYIPEPFWVCWVRAITYTAHPAPQWTAMGPDIQNLRKLDEIRNTGRGGPMSCSREAGEPCWLLPHSTGSDGSGPSHTQPIHPLRGQPWGLAF